MEEFICAFIIFLFFNVFIETVILVALEQLLSWEASCKLRHWCRYFWLDDLVVRVDIGFGGVAVRVEVSFSEFVEPKNLNLSMKINDIKNIKSLPFYLLWILSKSITVRWRSLVFISWTLISRNGLWVIQGPRYWKLFLIIYFPF